MSNLIIFPLVLGAAAIVACIVAVFFVRLGKDNKIMWALYKGVIVSTVVAAILFYIADYLMMDGNINIFLASLVGLGVMACMVIITEYYTSTAYRPVKEVAKSSQTGAGTNIITGIAMGLEATALPVLVIVIGIVLAYYFAGRLWYRHRSGRHAVGHRHHRGGRLLRPDHGQRRRHRRNGGPAPRGQEDPRTRWTRSATPPRRSPKVMPSVRRRWRRWPCSRL